MLKFMLKRRQNRVAGECKSGCFGEFMCWRIGEFVHESIYKFASVFGVYPRFTTYKWCIYQILSYLCQELCT